MSKLLILTWVSASGKTKAKEELVERWWKSAINFTTRKPRSDKEKDDYVFVDRKTFFKKLANGDFIEHTQFNWEEYAVSRCLPLGNVVTILDPVGRNQIMEKYTRAWIKVHTIYLNVNQEEQLRRLNDRNLSVTEIKERQLDYHWFDRTKFCLEIDNNWDEPIEEIVDYIEAYIFNWNNECDF